MHYDSVIRSLSVFLLPPITLTMPELETERKDDSDEALPAIGATEAALRLGDLIARAQYAGERTVITKHGKAVAALIPFADLEKLPPAA